MKGITKARKDESTMGETNRRERRGRRGRADGGEALHATYRLGPPRATRHVPSRLSTLDPQLSTSRPLARWPLSRFRVLVGRCQTPSRPPIVDPGRSWCVAIGGEGAFMTPPAVKTGT
jgi:hypothetical protein